jgi:hypothetical protein
MNRNHRSGSRLFFIEFLIVLFFFLIISTVCLRLFFQAHQITVRANARSGAQAAASSVAAAISSGDGSVQDITDFFPGATAEDDTAWLFFDKDFQMIEDAASASYLMTVNFPSGAEKTAQITVSDYFHETLYELSVSFHQPLTRKEALQ